MGINVPSKDYFSYYMSLLFSLLMVVISVRRKLCLSYDSRYIEYSTSF